MSTDKLSRYLIIFAVVLVALIVAAVVVGVVLALNGADTGGGDRPRIYTKYGGF